MRNHLKILCACIPTGQKTITALTIIIILFGFTETANMVTGNWYQQFMPSISSRQITDITFIDSLTGFAVTNATNQATDTTFVLKTTNSGDTWIIQYRKIQTGGGFFGLSRVYFLNQNTGYLCGVTGLDKSTNGGSNWAPVNVPVSGENYLDMSILNIDTIWLTTSEPFLGGVFRTTNGGASWDHQFSGGNQNPNKIYMFNSRIGFMGNNSGTPRTYKTTNSGLNWDTVLNKGFSDMFFIDSMTGWTAYDSVRKTTNGGLNWVTEIIPGGGNIFVTQVLKFSGINKDTIWAFGGVISLGGTQNRGILYRTTNGGNNWLFQLPDTSIHIARYNYGTFINKLNGWAYNSIQGGIHTTNGGDTNWFTGIKQISGNVPMGFKLFQNYPNPFNPKTIINYELQVTSYIKLTVFDITGKHIIDLVNQKQSAGTYQVDFSGNSYSSGIYFYQLIADNKIIDTKKMILLK